MLFLWNDQFIIAEATLAYRHLMAREFGVDPRIIQIEWVLDGKSGIAANVKVEFSPAPPPSEVDVNNPIAMQAWRDHVESLRAELPTIEEFLAGKGFDGKGKCSRCGVFHEVLHSEVVSHPPVVSETPDPRQTEWISKTCVGSGKPPTESRPDAKVVIGRHVGEMLQTIRSRLAAQGDVP